MRVFVAFCLLAAASSAPADNARLTWTGGEPAWLGAVGKLQVPSQRYENRKTRYYTEDCSATLVSRAGARKTNVIVSAWHCLEHYRDLSREIRFSLTGKGAKNGVLLARTVASGGSMDADWAVLQLEKDLATAQVQTVLLQERNTDESSVVTMAGYSRIGEARNQERPLTYDHQCQISARSYRIIETDCVAFKGASGGAVVQVSRTGDVRYAGVISAGNGEGISHYIPLARFRGALERALKGAL